MNLRLQHISDINDGGGFGSLFGERIIPDNQILSLPLQPPKKLNIDLTKKIKTQTEETSETAPAGITAEAALAFPVFLLFCGIFLSVFLSLRQGSVCWYEADREAERLASQILYGEDAAEDRVTVTRTWQAGIFPEQHVSVTRRAWTGRFLPLTHGTPQYVIVTEHASVYHLTESCTYLTLSVH